MAYTTVNFKTKKALKEAVAAGQKIGVWQPNGDVFGITPESMNGKRVTLEGPHYPAPHTWYAQADVDNDGYIVRVK